MRRTRNGKLTKNMSTMTGQASAVRATVPRRRRTSRARSHQTSPIACLDLLLVGMAQSTYERGESVSQRAMTGMLTYEASRMAWWSTRGSVTMIRRGSLKERAVIELVKAPGTKRPAMAWAPVLAANLRTARCP